MADHYGGVDYGGVAWQEYLALSLEEDEKPDLVNHPPHYTQGGIECIEAIAAAFGTQGGLDFCRGNALKYLWRAEHKGNFAGDMAKAVWYINKAVELYAELEKEDGPSTKT